MSSGPIEVIKKDGTTEIVTIEEAQAMRDAGELWIPPADRSDALALGDVYGEDFDG